MRKLMKYYEDLLKEIVSDDGFLLNDLDEEYEQEIQDEIALIRRELLGSGC